MGLFVILILFHKILSNTKTEKLVQTQYTLSYPFLKQYIKFNLRVGPTVLCALLNVWWSDQHALHRALTADVFGSREEIIGVVMGCVLAIHSKS